jgi:CheY-like chemotaxis protein
MDSPADSLINILLVEDDNDDIDFFTDAFKGISANVKITVAGNSAQMFSHLDNDEKFDIIFLDINLPIMNGIECLKLLKEKTKYRHIPIIMLTGSQSENDINETYQKGAHHYIPKPYKPLDYEFCLKAVMELKWQKNLPQPPPDKYLIKPHSG